MERPNFSRNVMARFFCICMCIFCDMWGSDFLESELGIAQVGGCRISHPQSTRQTTFGLAAISAPRMHLLGGSEQRRCRRPSSLDPLSVYKYKRAFPTIPSVSTQQSICSPSFFQSSSTKIPPQTPFAKNVFTTKIHIHNYHSAVCIRLLFLFNGGRR